MSGTFDFDNCRICSAAKSAERKGIGLSEAELKNAFDNQRAQQQVRAKNQQVKASTGHKTDPDIVL